MEKLHVLNSMSCPQTHQKGNTLLQMSQRHLKSSANRSKTNWRCAFIVIPSSKTLLQLSACSTHQESQISSSSPACLVYFDYNLTEIWSWMYTWAHAAPAQRGVADDWPPWMLHEIKTGISISLTSLSYPLTLLGVVKKWKVHRRSPYSLEGRL